MGRGKNKILKQLLSFTSLFRYQLRVRYFPKDLKELYTRDKVTFFYLFDQVKESLIINRLCDCRNGGLFLFGYSLILVLSLSCNAMLLGERETFST